MASSRNNSRGSMRLYIDGIFRILRCKDNNLCDTENLLRELCIIIDRLDENPNSTSKLRSEMLTEYYNITDKERPGMLSVLCDPQTEINKNALSSQDEVQTKYDRMDLAFEELMSTLNNFKINVPSLNITKPVNQNASIHLKTSIPISSSVANRNFRPQFKPCIIGASTKRTVEKNEDSIVEHVAKKHTGTWKQGNKKPVTQPNREPPKSGTGFMSASSMYRNPLKKAKEDIEPTGNDSPECSKNNDICNHESLKHIDKKIVNVIFNEIMDFSPNVKWSDIAGLDFVKTTVQEIVIWPLLRPDIFTGLRAPPRGILLFGPPGTGKTLIGKCIATESNSTFFCISASSLASKWVGESEQLVRALFTVANLNQPAVIFIDEIDSLLSQRSDKDQDFTRKLKTEFLVQFDGAKTSSESRVLVVGATNRPHELDEAARRRFVKRLYVPLPEESARRQIIETLLAAHDHSLSDTDLKQICEETKGYSCSDVTHLCKEAAMGPIRSIGPEHIKTVSLDQVRPIILNDFLDALRQVRASVAQDDLNYYLEWNKKFGSFGV